MKCLCNCDNESDFIQSDVDFSTMETFLIISSRNKTQWIIERVKTGKDQHFTSLIDPTRVIAGHYDAAIIDGSNNSHFDPYQAYNDLYPYLKRNVKNFYILLE